MLKYVCTVNNVFGLIKVTTVLIKGLHWTNALPSIPPGQLHIGMWFRTSQMAFWAQVPGHGFIHLLLRQAFSLEHSEFSMHSGRHPKYGSPLYSGKHVQIPLIHWVFDPQGDGLHGSSNNCSFSKVKMLIQNWKTDELCQLWSTYVVVGQVDKL